MGHPQTESPVSVRSRCSSSSRLIIIMNKKLMYIAAVVVLVVATTVVLLVTVGPLDAKTTTACDVIDTHKDALLALKEGLIGNYTNNRLADWDNNTDPCADMWAGITCNDSCDVTQINVGK
jgi:hypothetical protein